MTTSDINTENLKINFYPNVSTFESRGISAGDELHVIPNSSYVIDSSFGTSSWYRVWSDGYIEQGGKATLSSGSKTVTFLRAYSGTDYSVFINGTTSQATPGIHYDSPKTNSSVKICLNGATSEVVFWRAVGY